MQITTTTRVPKFRDPTRLILYGAPKVGKTTALSMLPNCYTFGLEGTGLSFVEIVGDEYGNLLDLQDGAKQVRDQLRPTFAAVDTLDALEDLAEDEATARYKKSPVGASFRGDSVLELDYGKGYHLLRERMNAWMAALGEVAPHLIFTGHLRDSALTKTAAGVESKDLALTGKVRQIVCARADAIGYIYRDPQSNLRVSFVTSEAVTCGARAAHLAGKVITLAEKTPSGHVWHWERIYTQLSPGSQAAEANKQPA